MSLSSCGSDSSYKFVMRNRICTRITLTTSHENMSEVTFMQGNSFWREKGLVTLGTKALQEVDTGVEPVL